MRIVLARRAPRYVLAGAALLVLVIAAGCTSSAARPRVPVPTSTPFAPTGKATRLPLHLGTFDASDVITIVATNAHSTTAQGQAWTAAGHGSWRKFGPAFVAHVGAHGVTRSEREGLTATPSGSFTLTQAFGRMPNPGLRLPYVQTTPHDWWVSQPGPLYNTFQQCVTACRFNTGSPNAQLYYVQPQYTLAVVINYNRYPVVQGAGSGIFLHVTSGRPTNGCVSMPYRDLVQLARWLRPGAHPRILIGVRGS